jgi:transcriptional regulator with XRE-family HTH domain
MEKTRQQSHLMASHSELLLELLIQKKKQNPQYSLRSFAKQLSMSPAHLSQLISGKRTMTFRVAKQIADRLSLSPWERKVLAQGASAMPLDTLLDESDEFRSLKEDQFKAISDWYHFAILSLSELKDNEARPKWIAQRLNLDELIARDAFERLKRLRLIEVSDGKFRQSTRPLQTTRDVSSAAIRKYHHQNLKLAAEKLDSAEIDLREFSAITMAIDPSRIKRAKQMIEKFKREICRELNAGVKQEVYTLAIQLFPVSSQRNKK